MTSAPRSALFMLVITTFYAGDTGVARTRKPASAQMFDALPIPSWLPLLSKLFALIGLQALLLVVVMVCGMSIQIFHGYFQLEPGLYVRQLFLIQLPQLCADWPCWPSPLQVLVNQQIHGLLRHDPVLRRDQRHGFSSLGLDHPHAVVRHHARASSIRP